MPLTDPELDLLREMLEDDPADEAFLQVGEELVRRSRWADAQEILSRGLAQQPDPKGFELLARAALETGHFDFALSALANVDRDPSTGTENARVEILTLERAGRLDEARARAVAFLARVPDDVVVEAVIDRLDAPPPAGGQRAQDPFYTVDRAERYLKLGRPDRALRAYRRIQLANPGDERLALRVRQLAAAKVGDGLADDLSEDLTDPSLVPAEPSVTTAEITKGIAMPQPSISTATPVAIQRAARPHPGNSAWIATDDPDSDEPTTDPRFGADDPDEEDTDLNIGRHAAPEPPPSGDPNRRRRSLIRK